MDHQHALLSLQLQFGFDHDIVIFMMIQDPFKKKYKLTLSAQRQRLLTEIKVNFHLASTQQKVKIHCFFFKRPQFCLENNFHPEIAVCHQLNVTLANLEEFKRLKQQAWWLPTITGILISIFSKNALNNQPASKSVFFFNIICCDHQVKKKVEQSKKVQKC